MNNLTINNDQINNSSIQAFNIATSMVLTNESDLSKATDFIKMISGMLKDAETQRKELVAPFNEGVKNINNKFKPITTRLEEAKKIAQHKAIGLQKIIEEQKRIEAEKIRKQVEEEARLRAEEERARQQAEAEELAKAGATEEAEKMKQQANAEFNNFNNQLDYAMTKLIAIEKTRGKNTGAVLYTRKKLCFEVVDILEIAKHKPQLLEVNSAKVLAMHKAGEPVNGVRYYYEEIIASK